MSEQLLTSEASIVLEQVKAVVKDLLDHYNESRFDAGASAVSRLREELAAAKETASGAREDYLTDMYVLERYLDLLEAYGVLWRKITEMCFADSWRPLQDALDLLRVIKRFSRLDVQFFEDQLLELEQAYPYNVFFSAGIIVHHCECSICGQDIDSEECPHIAGNLYSGVMAHGVVRNITALDCVFRPS